MGARRGTRDVDALSRFGSLVMLDVVVETPRGARNKYEWDEAAGRMRLDRRVPGAVSFPVDYGFVPNTRAADGDPLDALVILEEPTFPGVVVATRAVGVCWIRSGGEREPKLICIAQHEPSYDTVQDLDDLPHHLLDEIAQFFDSYKDLEAGHAARFDGFDNADAAQLVIRDCGAD